MNALEVCTITNSRETIEPELRRNTFEVCMHKVDIGELTFDEAVAEYRRLELSPSAQSELAITALASM